MTLVFTGLSSMIWVSAQDVANGQISSGELGAFIFYALLVAMAVAMHMAVARVWLSSF